MRIARLSSGLLLLFALPLAAAGGPKEILVLRPSADSEIRRPFLVVVGEDGTRTVFSRIDGRPPAPSRPEAYALDWAVDLERGTYTARRATVSDVQTAGPRLRRVTQSNVEPIIYDGPGGDNGPGPGTSSGARYTGTYSVDASVLGVAPDPASRTIADVQWKVCQGNDFPESTIESLLGRCLANSFTNGTGWATTSCIRSVAFENEGSVTGRYATRPGTTPSATLAVTAHVRVDANHLQGWFTGSTTAMAWGAHEEYSFPSWGDPVACSQLADGGGGGGGGGDSPGGGDGGMGGDDGGGDGGDGGGDGGSGWGCVTVRDGLTREALGVCCGTTTMIVSCAADYAG